MTGGELVHRHKNVNYFILDIKRISTAIDGNSTWNRDSAQVEMEQPISKSFKLFVFDTRWVSFIFQILANLTTDSN